MYNVHGYVMWKYVCIPLQILILFILIFNYSKNFVYLKLIDKIIRPFL